MKKIIVVLIVLFCFFVPSYEYQITDLLKVQRYLLGYENLNIVDKIIYDLNHDKIVDYRDLNIIQSIILNGRD